MEHGQHLHIPTYMRQRMAAWDRTVHALEAKLDRAPTPEELADAMDVPRSKLRVIQRTMAATKSASTGAWCDEDGRSQNVDLHADEVFEPATAIVERREDVMKMRGLLSGFDDMAARIIRMRFGLDGRMPLTLKEAGLEVGLTRERVRQIEQAAIARLREAFRESGVMAAGRMGEPLPHKRAG
jgi:RNA polymerase primary sigma factor